jgi:hypothetical protein
MRGTLVAVKLIEYLRFTCTIAGKSDERALQTSAQLRNVRNVQICERWEWVMRISFVWAAGMFPGHLKVQYEL